MNNIDIAKQSLRQLQQKIYDPNISTNEVNQFLEREVIPLMDKASIEISSNYEEISRKLTAQLNSGKPQ